MLKTTGRLVRHAWLDASDARRVISPSTAERLRERVAESERQHTGEIRICVEGGLPASYLWRHVWHRVPIQHIARERAMMMFSKLRVWDTERNNGVLIYLLLAERAIELVADRDIVRRVGQDQWQATVEQLGHQLRQGEYEAGLMQALDSVSDLLQTHYQRDPNSDVSVVNELPDEPVLR